MGVIPGAPAEGLRPDALQSLVKMIGNFNRIHVSFGSAAYKWLSENACRCGWINPRWALPDGSGPDGAWAWEFYGVA